MTTPTRRPAAHRFVQQQLALPDSALLNALRSVSSSASSLFLSAERVTSAADLSAASARRAGAPPERKCATSSPGCRLPARDAGDGADTSDATLDELASLGA